MSAIQVSLLAASGEQKGKIDLPASLVEGPISRYVLHEYVVSLRANQRRGTSATKSRGMVSGGGHKPWKQKGTGNARAGSNRSPLWRKGGIIFGPHPRSYRINLPEQKKWMALTTILAEKAKSNEIKIFESMPGFEGKTRNAEGVFQKAGVSGKILFVIDKKDSGVVRAIQNMHQVAVVDVQEVNAGLILASNQILMTQSALDVLSKRIPKG